MSYPVITSKDDDQVEWKSSAKQYSEFLSVLKGGTWLPISFDQIDYIDCNHIASHPAITTDKDFVGYHFKICKRKIYTDQYLTYDKKTVEVRTAPKWFGGYEYEYAVDEDDYVYDDEGGWLGTRRVNDKYVETAYALAKTTLPGVE